MPLPDVGLRAVIDNMGGFMSSAKKVDQAMGRLGGSAQKSAGRMGTLGKVATQAMGTAMGIVGYKAVGALTGAMSKSISVAGDFQAQMNILGVAARSSGTAIDELREAAIAVGADTELVGISAAEAADALTNFYKAGLETGDVFEDLEGYLNEGISLTGALRSAVDLAAASELNLGQASEVVAISMATFGLEAKDAARIADSFVGAADASIAEVEDLTAALAGFGPTAAQFGWSLEETNQALAVLSTRGIAGSEAGTALRSMMTNLSRDTDPVTDTLRILGVELYNTEGDMYSLRQIVGQLSESVIDLTEEERNMAIQTLAGTYGMKAMSTLLEEGTEGWDAMGEAINKAATAQEVAAARTKGWNAAMEQFHGAIETVMIKVGTPLIEKFLTPAIMKITDFISILVMGGPKVARWADWLKKVASVASMVLVPIVGLAKVFSTLVGIDDPLGSMRGMAGGFWDRLFPEGLSARVAEIGAVFEWLHSTVEGLFSGIGEAFERISSGQILTGLGILQAALAAVFSPEIAKGTRDVVARIIEFVGKAKTEFDRLKDAAVGVWQKRIYPRLAAIKEGVREWWEEGGISKVLASVSAGWSKMAAGLTNFYRTYVGPKLLGITLGIAAWFRRARDPGGILNRIGAGWAKYIAEPLTNFYQDHLAGKLANLKALISGWWASLTSGDGIMVNLGAMWNKHIAMPLQNFYNEHLKEPLEELRRGLARWGEQVWEILDKYLVQPIAQLPATIEAVRKELAKVAEETPAGGAAPEKGLFGWLNRGGQVLEELHERVTDNRFIMGLWDIALALKDIVISMAKYVALLDDFIAAVAGFIRENLPTFVDLHRDFWNLLESIVPLMGDQNEEGATWGTTLGIISDVLQTVVDWLDRQRARMEKNLGAAQRLRREIQKPIVPPPIVYTIITRGSAPDIRGGLPAYQTGGTVPGPTGAAQLAVVHGGEEILTPQQQAARGIPTLKSLGGATVEAILGNMQRINQELSRTVGLFGRLGASMMPSLVSASPGNALARNALSSSTVTQWAPVVNANYVDTQSPIAISDDLEALAIAMRMMS